MEGKWLSVLEFAAHKKKSISTVRRYIKANRVKHKEENGKYFIFVKIFYFCIFKKFIKKNIFYFIYI